VKKRKIYNPKVELEKLPKLDLERTKTEANEYESKVFKRCNLSQ